MLSRTTTIAPSIQIVESFTTAKTGRLRYSVDWVDPEHIVGVVLRTSS